MSFVNISFNNCINWFKITDIRIPHFANEKYTSVHNCQQMCDTFSRKETETVFRCDNCLYHFLSAFLEYSCSFKG